MSEDTFSNVATNINYHFCSFLIEFKVVLEEGQGNMLMKASSCTKRRYYVFAVAATALLTGSALVVVKNPERLVTTGTADKTSVLFVKSSRIEYSQTQKSVSIIPHDIWMLWDKGWHKAPVLQAMCLRSFRRHNQNFTIHALNLTEAEQLIGRRRYYSDSAWGRAPIQAKSDIIRVELLWAYGGIWADATAYCNHPLLDWIGGLVEQSTGGFFAYERKDSEVNSGNSPWIASWFLVATKDSRIIRTWGEDNMTFSDAAGPHCLDNNTEKMPHLYKAKAPSCRKVRARLLMLEKSIQRRHLS